MKNTTTTQGNAKALAAYVAAVADIQESLSMLTEAAENNFEANPSEIHWGHVGDVNMIKADLRQIIGGIPQLDETADNAQGMDDNSHIPMNGGAGRWGEPSQ